MEFPIKTWFEQTFVTGLIEQNSFLQEDIKAAIPLWPKEMTVIDNFNKTTVVILVESYGVNKSIPYTKALLAPFDSSKADFLGIYPRKASHTQGAEWEDFGTFGGRIQETPLPLEFKQNNFQTWYIHGYSGNFYERKKSYASFGFDSLLFRKDLEKKGLLKCHWGFDGICDSSIIEFIDSLITDSIPKFIYWTTLDAHPPYELSKVSKKSTSCKTLSLSEIDCTYITLQENTMQRLAGLAAKHPDCQFIIRGDHRPMGSLSETKFVQSFYFRWVPLIILK